MERRLAAIFAADMVGYSRLTEADEVGTLTRQKLHRAELIDPKIEQHGGRIIKLTGDGMIAEFPSVVEAVQCAVSVQREMAAREADVPDDNKIRFRVAVNLGDVIFDDGDVYGDGVNIAARLESLAEPGGVVVSGTAYDHLKANIEVGYEELGEKSLKNIASPVRVYRVVTRGSAGSASAPPKRLRAIGAVAVFFLGALAAGGWYLSQPAPADAISADKVLTIKGPTIAALPLINLSGDPQYDLFARGMSNQVIAALTRFKGVRVLSPRASKKYSDDLEGLRNDLGADYLLDGSIRRSAEQIQITAILIKVESGTQIWTDTFEAEVTPANIVEVQDHLAGKIASVIADDRRGIALMDRVADQVNAAPDNQASLDCIIAAGTTESEQEMRASYNCLTKALERDPKYAAGWYRLSSLLVDSYIDGPLFNDTPGYDPRSEILEAAQNAVRLAPNSSGAHFALAEAYYYQDDQERFLAEVAKAMELNPNDAASIAWLGTLMAFSGHWDEGGALVEKALAFNPSVVAPSSRYALAKAHYVRGEYAEALDDFQPIWAAYPGYWINDLNRAYLYADWGKQAEAEKAATALLEQLPDFVVEDAAEFYSKLRFQESYINRMLNALKKAGLPSRTAS